MNKKMKDLTGQKFGKLTVIRWHGYTNAKRKNATWLCQCDCGNYAVRTGKVLKDGGNSGCEECKHMKSDLTGERFGKLLVVEKYKSIKGQIYWKCQCDCGNVVYHATGRLKSGVIISCGCSKREKMIKMNTTHGLSNTRLYEIWSGMKKRCYDKNCKAYENYGGRGIVVCDEWKNDFESFYDWSMNNGYADDLSIDRIENDGIYSPNNCKWSTPEEQVNNRRVTLKYSMFGIEKPLKEWSNMANANYSRIYQRYKNGNNPFDECEIKRIKECIGDN